MGRVGANAIVIWPDFQTKQKSHFASQSELPELFTFASYVLSLSHTAHLIFL